ncbi:hypothetical protein SAMD00019534_051870 [Acytostelium subglobosum LB1]|uniref:hypothetical protein n=1 Tax=Acytostelium subglobosum LB1 TaxID=1410327 RepID=UPI000644D80C|nr:hypothetical protein SAMD00019534_051870 [Acytostelium subglobosum LB1]GAM22012.1 hypothetical protein SAMD00019534_051870 [Acytostelium subglobosum LB1]|eukprot:XP_012755112.1 hypothetical protein SAMD00019534_051870 [Acytostelium subglobosum LB1]
MAIGRAATSKKRSSSSSSRKKRSLFVQVIMSKANIKKLVSSWTDRYNEDAEEATLELVNFMVEAGGAEEMTMQEYKSSFKKGSEEVCESEDSKTYPLANKRSKTTPTAYCSFFEQVVAKCQTSILFDEYLLEMIVLWSKEFAEASSRGVRHATVLGCVAIVEAVLKVCSELKRELNLTSRQISSEGSVGKSTERLKTLKENQLQLTNKLKHLESLVIGKFYATVFKTRVNDIQPEIRGIIIEHLPVWILEHPSLMLSGDLLKHIGWGLNDWANDVRMSAVKGLIQLYSNEDHLTQFDDLTQVFGNRIVDIASADKVDKICAEAIKLVAIMAKHSLIEQDKMERVFDNYMVDNPVITHAAGDLLFQVLIKPHDEKLASLPKGDKKGAKNEMRQQQLAAVLDFLDSKSKAPDVPYYLVLAMWEQAEHFFTDWPFFVGLLNSLEEQDYTEKQLITITRIIAASVKISCGQKIPVFTIDGQKFVGQDPLKRNAVEPKYEDTMIEITTNFLGVIPELLSQYKSVNELAINLIEVARYFKMETYITLRQQTKYADLLDVINEVLNLHPNERLVETVALTLLHLSQCPSQLESAFNLTIQQLFSGLITSIRNLSEPSEDAGKDKAEEEDPDSQAKAIATATSNEKLYTLHSQLVKLRFIGSQINCEDPDLHLLLLPLMDGMVGNALIQNSDYREKIIMTATMCQSQMIMWEVTNMEPDVAAQAPISKASTPLYFMFYQFVHRMNLILESSKATNSLKHFAYVTLTEVLLFFNPLLEKSVAGILSLHVPKSYKLLESKSRVLFEIENDHVFDAIRARAEDEDEELNNEETRSSNMKKKTGKSSRLKKGKKKQRIQTESEDDGDDEEQEEEGEGAEDEEHDKSEATSASDKETAKKKYKFNVEKDTLQLDSATQLRIEQLLITTIQAIETRIIPQNMIGVVLKQVALSPGPRSLAIIKEYVAVLRSRVTEIKQEAAIISMIIKEFFHLCDSIEDDKELKEHMYGRLRGLIDWMCTEFMRKDSLGQVFESGLKYFFGNDHTSPDHPQFLRCVSFLIPKLTHEQAVEIMKRKEIYDENDEDFKSLNNVYKMVEMISNSKKKSLKRKGKRTDEDGDSDESSDQRVDDDDEDPIEDDYDEEEEFELSQQTNTSTPKKKQRR